MNIKKFFATILALASAGFAFFAVYSMVSAPAEPARGWRMHMSEQQHALLIAPIDHAYRVSAYAITWAVQLGYLGWIALKWSATHDEAR